MTINEGDELGKDTVVVILEAMKLEIAVRTEDHLIGLTVEKVLVRPNDVVKAGDVLVLAKKG